MLTTETSGYLAVAGALLVVAGVFAADVPQVFSATPAAPVADVALRADGTLLGQVVNSSGNAVPNERVSLQITGKEVAASTTDRAGFFAFSGLRTGLCAITTVRGGGYYRVWDASVAPPSAQPGAMIVAAERAQGVVRGQTTGWNWRHPALIGGVLGLGVGAGVTAAIYEHNRDSASD